MSEPQYANGKWWIENPDGSWSESAELRRHPSAAEVAKRVVTHDIPNAYLRFGDIAANLGRSLNPFEAISRSGETAAETIARKERERLSGGPGLTQQQLPDAQSTNIREEDMTPAQRLARDTTVGIATAAPFLASGGPVTAAPVILGGAGGGLFGGIAREAGLGPKGQFIAGTIGGGLAASAPSIASGLHHGVGRFSSAGRAAAAEAAAVRTLATRAQNRVESLSALELPPRPPGQFPTLGSATEDVGLRTLEGEMARVPTAQISDKPGYATRLAEVRERALDTSGAKLKSFSGGTEADVEAARSTLQGDVTNAVSKLQSTGAGANPNVKSTDLYNALRQTSDEVYAPIKARLNRYGDALDEAGVSFQPTKTREAIAKIKENAVFREMMAMQQEGEGKILTLMDNVVSRKTIPENPGHFGILTPDFVSDTPQPIPMSFREQDALRSYITELRASPNRALRNEAENLHRALEDDLRAAVSSGPAGSIHANYRKALDDFADASTIYRRDVLEDVTNNRGTFKPETVLGRMWLSNTSKAGAGASAKQLRTALGPRTQTGVDAIVADAFYKSADSATGVVNAKQLAKYMRDHSEALKEFPEARDVLSQAMKTQRAAENMGITKNGAAIERGSFAQFVDDPDAAVRDVMRLRGAQRQRAIAKYQTRLKGNPSAEKGFKRLVWERMSSEATDQSTGGVLWSPGKVRNMVADNEQTIRQLWGEDGSRIIKSLADEYDQIASITDPSGVAAVTVPQASEGLFHSGMRLLTNRINGLPLQTVRASELIHGFMGRKTAIEAQRLLEEAFLDPYGRGRALLLKANKQNERRILAAIRAPSAAIATASASQKGDNQ